MSVAYEPRSFIHEGAYPPIGDEHDHGADNRFTDSDVAEHLSHYTSDAAMLQDDRDGISSSQTAEYAAMDQSILAKRVGLPPEPSVKPIPLDLTYRPPPESTSDDEDEDDEDDGHFGDDDDGDAAIAPDDSETGSVIDDGSNANVSVSHVLTNVIIFQSFLMELASLMQVRAGLFDEVRYV
ncbi:hypothetical protein NLG97_g703 [Lecanicillium saksenae]|uniref:Uncharacterized protein n=1 Tax=Lecanicillium saksenae TaxID=468837 RepID=A0ACC1R7S8_9HYPO|nr:hypothetical protein NLG97_g703 [Lecanicillium saksenae]